MAGLLPPGCPIRTPTDQSLPRLPVDFRSLLRPSSPDGAKASVVCPYALDRNERISPDPGAYVAILLTQKLCSFQGTSATASRPRRARVVAEEIVRNTSRRRAAGVVGVTGIGPVTSSLSGTRSNQLSYTPGQTSRERRPARPPRPRGAGGGSRTRTGDIQLAKLALYQLSYAPDANGELATGGRLRIPRLKSPAWTTSGREGTRRTGLRARS